MDLEALLGTAVAAVRSATGAACRVAAALPTAAAAHTLQKEDRSPVTVADFAVQALVARALAAAGTDLPLVAEEDSAALRTPEAAPLRERVVAAVATALGEPVAAEQVLGWIDRGRTPEPPARCWVLDPIDGTKGFLRGGQFAIALALLVDGEVTLGVLGCPAYATPAGRGLLLHARRGGGAHAAAATPGAPAQRLRVSAGRALADCRVCESVDAGHSDFGRSAAVAQALGLEAAPVRMDSQAKYAAVARGDAEFYLRLPTRGDYREMIWDHAAGMLVVQEAGGTVTDVRGAPLDFRAGHRLERNRGVLASHGPFHDRLVAAVQQSLRG